MSYNRITSYLAGGRLAEFAVATVSQATQTAAAASQRPTMVALPVALQVGPWQAQLYRMAYERALADLAPPRHMTRFFSVWN